MKQILILVAILLAMLSIVNGMPAAPFLPRVVSTETKGLPPPPPPIGEECDECIILRHPPPPPVEPSCDECKNPKIPYF